MTAPDPNQSHQDPPSGQLPSGPTAPPTADARPTERRGRTSVVVGLSGWSGPLPPPDVLRDYDSAHPGLGGTLVQNMLAEADHRRLIENRALDAEIGDAKTDRHERARGQHYALVIGIISIVSGTVAAGLGHDLPGSLIGGGGVIGPVAVFIRGRATDVRPRRYGTRHLLPGEDRQA